MSCPSPFQWPSDWPKVRPPTGENYSRIRGMLKELKLSTVCQEALCPNIHECWNGGTATFMLMGDTCTRACRFCAVKTGNPKGWLDREEPVKVGEAIASMGLDYVVLTSVDRDDLDDLGSSHFALCVKTIKKNDPGIIVEALTPDFNAIEQFVLKVIDAGVDVYAHNLGNRRASDPQGSRSPQFLQTIPGNPETGKKALSPRIHQKLPHARARRK